MKKDSNAIKEREAKVEGIIENHPKEVAENSPIPEFRDEANDLLDSNPHNDEVNNEDVESGLKVDDYKMEGIRKRIKENSKILNDWKELHPKAKKMPKKVSRASSELDELKKYEDEDTTLPGILENRGADYRPSNILKNKLVTSEDKKAIKDHIKKLGIKYGDIEHLFDMTDDERNRYFKDYREVIEDSNKFQKLIEEDKDFRGKILELLGGDESVWGDDIATTEEKDVDPKMLELYKKYPNATFKDIAKNDELWDYYYEDPKKRKKRLGDLDPRLLGTNREELKEALAEVFRNSDEYFKDAREALKDKFSRNPDSIYDDLVFGRKPKDVDNMQNSWDIWEKNPFDMGDARDSIDVEDLKNYLDENYPEQIEDIIESNPKEAEVALESMGQEGLAKEAKEAQGDGAAKEVNNEEIKKAIGKSFVSPNVLLNSGYEDGLLKRDEEQQKEFDKIKEEADRKAAEWREQQANKFANRESKEVDNISEESPSREQPIEDNVIDENAYDAELKRLSGSKKKSKKRLTDMESNPLESLEFNPEEFNKQYEIDHPELKIKDELSDDEKNDIDYKPSQEELDALNQANREEWEENGRPRNKDLADKTIDLPNDFMDKQVEAAIESNPSQAEEVAEETLGEGNPIENEAEQANDPSIPQNDEVNNEEISKADPNQKSEFLNQMGNIDYPENGTQFEPDVVDYGLEDANNYAPNPLSDQTLDRIKNQLAEEEDKTIYKENNLPDLNIEQIPEEEMRKLFDPLNKEIESRQKALASAEENLQLAQMHFDENPNDENAAALNKANQAYKDAEFLLQNKQKEFEEAYKNLGNYYQPKEEIGEFIKEVKEEPTKLNLPEFGKSNDVNIHSTSTPSSNLNNSIDMSDKKSGVGGPRAGLGRIGGIGMGSIHSPNLSNNNNNPKMESLHSRASKAPIPEKRNENGAIVRGGSTNNKPSSNGTMSSGPSMLFGKHTNYQSPNKIAPAIPSLGHTSQVSPIGNVPGVGNSSKQDPKMILIAAIESKLNELSQKNPNLLQKLQLDHKYKHWAWKGISLDEMNPTQLNELYSKIN